MNISDVCVVMPAFNASGTIEAAIQSVRLQSDQDWTLIVVDDGSTDRTLEAAQRYESEDSRILVLSQENMGVSAARNHGLSYLKSGVVLFLDADDLLMDGAVAAVRQAMSESEFDLLFYKKVDLRGDGGSIPLIGGIPCSDTVDAALLSVVDARGSAGYCTNKAHNVCFLSENNLSFDPRLSFMEDADFEVRVLLCNPRVHVIDEVLYKHVVGVGISSAPYSEKRVASLPHLRELAISITPAFPTAGSALLNHVCHSLISLWFHSKRDGAPEDIQFRLLSEVSLIGSYKAVSLRLRLAGLALSHFPGFTFSIWQVLTFASQSLGRVGRGPSGRRRNETANA